MIYNPSLIGQEWKMNSLFFIKTKWHVVNKINFGQIYESLITYAYRNTHTKLLDKMPTKINNTR